MAEQKRGRKYPDTECCIGWNL